MLITNIRGEYVRQFPEININFEKGLVNINGDNGAGKTTILTLIELGLFGRINDVISTEIKYDQAKKSQKWWLELTFIVDKNEYCVFRHETSAKANLKVNGKELITGGQSEVTNHIVQKVLRMDQTSFSNAFYARQDDFDNLLKLTPEKRKKEISRLLRIDKLDDTVKNIRVDKNRLVTVIDEQSRQIKDLEYFSNNEHELKSSIVNITEKQDKQATIVQGKEIQYKKLLKQKKSLDITYEKHQSLAYTLREKVQEKSYAEMTMKNIRSELKEINNSKEEFALLQESVEKYDELVEKLQSLQEIQVLYVQKMQLSQHTQTLKSRLTAKKDRMDNLKKSMPSVNYLEQIQRINKEIIQLEESISFINDETVEIKSELAYVSNEGKRIKNERKNLQELGQDSPCPVCKRSMGNHFHTLSQDYVHNLEGLAAEHNKLSEVIQQKEKMKQDYYTNIHSLKQQKSEVEKKQRNFVKLQDELQMLHQDFQSDKKDYLTIQNQLDELNDITFDKDEYELLTNQVNKLRKKKERFSILSSLIAKEPKHLLQEKEVEEKIKIISTDIDTLEIQKSELNFDNEIYRSFQNKINLEVETLRAAEKELSLYKEQKKNYEVKMEQLEKEKNENESKIQKLELNKRELSKLIKSEEIVKGYKIKRMSKARPKIQSIMQELLSFTTNGKYDLVEIDEHYNVFIYRNGVKKPLHLYSGGEKKLIALCMRLAISRILTSQGEHKNFDYLALDEVLGSMDEGRQETIIEALKKLTSVFSQIFMITHNSNIKGLFDYTLQVEQNIDLSSRAFWVTENESLA